MNQKITLKNAATKTSILGKLQNIFTALSLIVGGAAYSQTYCQPDLDCTDDDVILNVTLSTLSNPSSCGTLGYNNFTALPAPTLITGTSYPISVTVGDGWSTEAVSVWIDYNNNGTFEQNEFTFIGVGSGSVVTESITIPTTVTPGNKRMRVRVAAIGAASATWDSSCDEEDGYGETEDYTVNIQSTGNINEVAASSLLVYKQNRSFIIDSPQQLIENAELYDLSGKLVYNKTGVNSDNLVIDNSGFANQLFILKVKTTDGNIQVKKLSNY